MKTKKTVYCIYETNEWHNRDFNKLVGVFTSKTQAIKAVRTIAIESEEPLTTDDYYKIESISQTKGRIKNFIIEQAVLNKSYYE